MTRFWSRDPKMRDPRYLAKRIEHHRWRVEEGGPYAEDSARVVAWLEGYLADALKPPPPPPPPPWWRRIWRAKR